jgi:hypothetical protein
MEQPGQSIEPKVVPFPGAAAAAPLGREAAAALVAGRVRRLRRVCGAMLGGVALLAAASLAAARAPATPGPVAIELPLVLAGFAMLLILATSRLQASILGRAGRGSPAAEPARAAAVVDAYARATTISFGLLAAAAALGPVIAAVTGTVRYALVICGAAALGMLARWPRHAAALGLLRRRGLA